MERFSFTAFLVLSIFLFPYWVTGVVLFLAMARQSFYWESVVLALFFDLLYHPPFVFGFPATISVFLVFVFIEWLKDYLVSDLFVSYS